MGRLGVLHILDILNHSIEYIQDMEKAVSFFGSGADLRTKPGIVTTLTPRIPGPGAISSCMSASSAVDESLR